MCGWCTGRESGCLRFQEELKKTEAPHVGDSGRVGGLLSAESLHQPSAHVRQPETLIFNEMSGLLQTDKDGKHKAKLQCGIRNGPERETSRIIEAAMISAEKNKRAESCSSLCSHKNGINEFKSRK